MKKRITALMLVLALIVTLCACTAVKKPNEEENNNNGEIENNNEGNENNNNNDKPDNKPDVLDKLREDTVSSGCKIAAAFIGYDEDGDIKKLIKNSGYDDAFPFISKISKEDIITFPGNEVYCIVPKDKDAKITVCEYIMTEDNEGPGEPVYTQTDGRPILVVGNVSDIISNIVVTVETKDGKYEYSPYMSLENGKLGNYSGEVFDFTIYENRA